MRGLGGSGASDIIVFMSDLWASWLLSLKCRVLGLKLMFNNPYRPNDCLGVFCG